MSLFICKIGICWLRGHTGSRWTVTVEVQYDKTEHSYFVLKFCCDHVREGLTQLYSNFCGRSLSKAIKSSLFNAFKSAITDDICISIMLRSRKVKVCNLMQIF